MHARRDGEEAQFLGSGGMGVVVCEAGHDEVSEGAEGVEGWEEEFAAAEEVFGLAAYVVDWDVDAFLEHGPGLSWWLDGVSQVVFFFVLLLFMLRLWGMLEWYCTHQRRLEGGSTAVHPCDYGRCDLEWCEPPETIASNAHCEELELRIDNNRIRRY